MEEIANIINQMKDAGVDGALIRKDGVKAYSTLSLDNNTSEIIASMSNIIETIMKTMKDKNNEIEISTGQSYIIIVPAGDYYLCGVTEDREKKKILREYADKIQSIKLEPAK
jgi:predicted regulator of Ras-like GTPase activity (Roadblock/LC7/MglB family)